MLELPDNFLTWASLGAAAWMALRLLWNTLGEKAARCPRSCPGCPDLAGKFKELGEALVGPSWAYMNKHSLYPWQEKAYFWQRGGNTPEIVHRAQNVMSTGLYDKLAGSIGKRVRSFQVTVDTELFAVPPGTTALFERVVAAATEHEAAVARLADETDRLCRITADNVRLALRFDELHRAGLTLDGQLMELRKARVQGGDND